LRTPSGRETSLVLVGRIGPTEVRVLVDRVGELLAGGAGHVVVCDVSRLVVDLGALDGLGRLQLTATRLGGRIALVGASDELDELVGRCGLSEVLGRPAPTPGGGRGARTTGTDGRRRGTC
jgi:STAS domain